MARPAVDLEVLCSVVRCEWDAASCIPVPGTGVAEIGMMDTRGMAVQFWGDDCQQGA